MDELSKDLEAIHARWAPVEQRVAEIRENIEHDCADLQSGESYNRANERQVEEFIARLRDEFAGRVLEGERGSTAASRERLADVFAEARKRTGAPSVVVERQRLSKWALRTTRWNFVLTVPGERLDAFVLVAHYDTWRGPGADDNTTGEEIVKQYLLADLRAAERPKMTHVYFLAGSEECGLVGLFSQLLLAGGLVAGMQAWQANNGWLLLVALALCPLASYRIGVSGSREYVRALSPDELRHIRAVVSVDSVGEGRMYIPRSTLGADFIRALIPFGDYDAFTDVLEEGAHLHGIKYNNYIAGGTTDHVSFLEVNNGLWARTRGILGQAWSWLAGKDYKAPRLIPASALVAMLPGKASPVVFGGKIHTPNDVPERVYERPLREALLILDYLYFVLDDGKRVRVPRKLGEFHYARLYEVTSPRSRKSEYWLALKDALEPNRRNLNMVFHAEAEVDESAKTGTATLGEAVGWGVDTRLREEVAELCGARDLVYRRVRLDRLAVSDGQQELVFGRRLSVMGQLHRYGLRTLGWIERQMGTYSFISFFIIAYLIAVVVTTVLAAAFTRWFAFQTWFFAYEWLTIPLMLLLQIGVLVYLMARRIPTWIDNHYRHENRANNMGSLRRLAN